MELYWAAEPINRSTTAANNHSSIIFVMGRMHPGASPPIQAARFAATPPRPDVDTVNIRSVNHPETSM